jgi:hypothetical protein
MALGEPGVARRRDPKEFAAGVSAALLAAGGLILQLAPYLQVELIDRDEAYYRSFALVAGSGGKLYTDFWDTHFPALYGVYAFILNRAGDMTALRLFTLGTIWVGAVLFYVLLRRATGRGMAIFGATAFALMVTSVGLEGRGVNTEQFIQTCIMAALVLASRSSPRRLLVASGFIGIAALFKQQAILYLAVLAVTHWRQSEAFRRNPAESAAQGSGRSSQFKASSVLGGLTLLGLGAATPIVLALAWAVAQGSLEAMLRATVLGLFTERVGATSLLPRVHAARELFVHIFQHAPTIMLGAMLGVASTTDRRDSSTDSAAPAGSTMRGAASDERLDRYDVVQDLVWIGVGCLWIVLAGRSFPHYGILLVAPAMRMALAAADWSRPHRRAARSVGWALLAFIGVDAGLDAMRTIESQVGTYRSTIRAEEWDEHEVARYLNAQLVTGETIFVWGPRPGLYVSTDRVPTTRFVVQGSLVAESGLARTLLSELTESLRSQPPSYFIVTPAPREFSLERSELASLQEVLGCGYELERAVEGYEVYRRASPLPLSTGH